MSEIDDTVNIGTAMAMVSRKPGDPQMYACCPYDEEPLIMTLERPRAEFHCMVCGGWFGFLAPKPMDVTPDLTQRYERLLALFKGGIRGPMKEDGDGPGSTQASQQREPRIH